MPRNASGVYTLPAGNPVVPGTTIDAAWANNTLADMANEITNSLSRTGAGGMLAPFRIADGNVTAPGLSFLNETNSGLYRSAAGSLWMTLLGTNTMQFATTAVTVPSTRTFNAQGAALVGGTLGVTGAATFASTLAVTGALTATGGVFGNVTAASGTSTFTDVVITGALDMTAGSSATITGLSTPTNASDAANKGYVDTQDALKLSLTGGTMSGAIAMGTNKITGLGTPTNDADAATKAYVDQVAQGLDVKASVRAATTTNITLSGAQTIDGVAVIAGDRVLVKNQSSSADNGIYVAAAGAWSRSTDANTWDKLVGAFVFVEDGSTNDNSGWVSAVPPGGTLGVTAVTWEQFSGAGQINAGTGMTKSGNTLNVNTASASRIVVGADEIDLAQTGVAAGTYKSVTVDLYGRVTAGTNPTTLAGYGITDAYTNTQTDTLLAGKLSLTGGTMSGALAMGTNRITGMGDPVNAQDAATKNYIDTIFGSTTSAAASAAAAASSASAASTSASNASSSASSASASASNAATSLFNFRAQYLGPLASNPSVDGNGNPVTAGDLYWNTTANETRIYNGTAWVAAYVPGANYMDLTTNQTAAGVKTFSSNPILSGGTPNGVPYLNGSKVLTTGSALSFDGTTLTASNSAATAGNFKATSSTAQVLNITASNDVNTTVGLLVLGSAAGSLGMLGAGAPALYTAATELNLMANNGTGVIKFAAGGTSEQMRLTSTGLGIGTSSPTTKLTVAGSTKIGLGAASNSATLMVNNLSGSATGVQLFQDGVESWIMEVPASSTGLRWTASGAEHMRLTSAGNLGIGTSSPAHKLVVSNAGAAGFEFDPANGIIQTYNRSGGAYFDMRPYALNIRFFTGSSPVENMRLDASGNLGLGVTPGAWTTYRAMDIGGGQSVVSYQDAATNTVGFAANALWNGSWVYRQSSVGASRYQLVNNAHNWFTAASGTAGNPISFTQAMTLDGGGNLLVGGTSVYAATMTSYASASRSAGLGLRNSAGTTAGGIFTAAAGSGGGSTDVLVEAAGYLGFNTGGATERARITSAGNLLVGTTTDRGQAGISLIPNTSAGAGEITFNRASTTSTSYVVGFQNAGTTVGYIAYTNSTVTYNTGSDSRLKENVSPAPATGPIIDAIDIVQHDWKSGGHVDFSVIAQDLHQVYPQAVTPGDAGEEITQTWGVDYSKLVPLLIKEVQSLRSRVAQLEGA